MGHLAARLTHGALVIDNQQVEKVDFTGGLANRNCTCRKHVAHPFSGGAAVGPSRSCLGFGTHGYGSSFGKKALVQGSHTGVSFVLGEKSGPRAGFDSIWGGSFAAPSCAGPWAVTAAFVPRKKGACATNSCSLSFLRCISNSRSRRLNNASLRRACSSISR